jgi:hypothetical protein
MSEGVIHYTGKREGDTVRMTYEATKNALLNGELKSVREYSSAAAAGHIREAQRRYEDQCRQEAERQLRQQHMKDALRYLKVATVTHDTSMDFRKPEPAPCKRSSRVLLLL